MKKDILAHIEKQYFNLSKSQKKIANYILKNYDKVAFMTASELARNTKVSESTVVRFANAIDYSGYPSMQQNLQDYIKNKLTTVQRLEMNEDLDEKNIIYRAMKQDMKNVETTLHNIDFQQLKDISKLISSSNKVYILGLRSSSVIANYLNFYLQFILEDVYLLTNGVSDPLDSIINMKKEDSVIVISYPRYSKKTIEFLKNVKTVGTQIIGITDSTVSPIKEYSDYCLTANNQINSFIDSLVAPMSLVNSLILQLSADSKSSVENKFEKLEQLWLQQDTYNNH